jgi:hypothetical protein
LLALAGTKGWAFLRVLSPLLNSSKGYERPIEPSLYYLVVVPYSSPEG